MITGILQLIFKWFPMLLTWLRDQKVSSEAQKELSDEILDIHAERIARARDARDNGLPDDKYDRSRAADRSADFE